MDNPDWDCVRVDLDRNTGDQLQDLHRNSGDQLQGWTCTGTVETIQ